MMTLLFRAWSRCGQLLRLQVLFVWLFVSLFYNFPIFGAFMRIPLVCGLWVFGGFEEYRKLGLVLRNASFGCVMVEVVKCLKLHIISCKAVI
jgi:hypothetical protein